jgi:hypothetical protein
VFSDRIASVTRELEEARNGSRDREPAQALEAAGLPE